MTRPRFEGTAFVTTWPHSLATLDEASEIGYFTRILFIWAVGRKRPPLCRGCAPATPPSKTMPHRPGAFIPAIRLTKRAAW